MKKIYLLLLCLFSTKYFIAQETFPINSTTNPNHTIYAFTHATLVVSAEEKIEDATLIIQDGRITAIGAALKTPGGAVVYDLKGKFIYPGLIDIYTNYGLAEPKRESKNPGPQMLSNLKGAYGWNQAIKSETDASRLFNADSKYAEEMRGLGFGTVVTFQKDGIVRGTAAAVTLADSKENEVILKDKVAAMYSFDKGTSSQDYPSSLMGAIALLRQTYLDADWYKNDKNKTEFNISLQAFNDLQTLPQIFETTNKLNVLRADKIANEFKTKYIMKGSGTEYQRLDDIKASNCQFILPLNFPAAYDVEDAYDALNITLTELKHWEMAPVNPFALEKYLIPFAITTADLKDKKDFWKNLRKAVTYGLSEKQALKALTTTPAEMLHLSDQVGKLKPGMLANFIITSGNLFDEKTILYENWIQGKMYRIKDYNFTDIRGVYDFRYGDKQEQLTIEGDINKPKGKLQADTAKTPVSITIAGSSISFSFKLKKTDEVFRLSGDFSSAPVKMRGKGQNSKGEWIEWSAMYKAANPDETKTDTTKKEQPAFGKVIYPFCAFGKPLEEHQGFDKYIENFKNRYDAILIKHVTIWTNEEEGILTNQDVYITEGHIVRIADDINASKLAFAKVIDGTGKHLTSGIIDEHSHIAVSNGVNEGTQASSAEVRIGDVIDSEDINIYRQLSGGVTTSQLLHGSANPIGGQSGIIKLRWGLTPEKMKFEKADGFIKFALGENVKQSNWGELNTIRFPQSRMGVEQIYYDYFLRAKEYDAAMKAYAALPEKIKSTSTPVRRNLELEAIAEILNKKRFITCHSYIQSEVNMLMHVSDSMGFKVNTFTHILEGYKVADKIKAHGIGASTFSDWWAYKVEVKDAIPYNASLLTQMGVVTAINSDDAEMGRRLNQEAAKSVKYGGLSEIEAWKLVTLNPAKLLHIDNRVGSVKVGKDADLVLWSDNPLSIYARVEKTIIDGQIYFDSEEDQQLRIAMQQERARIIQKMMAEKSAGGATQPVSPKKRQLDGCDSIEIDYMNADQ
ncbi:MAG TPA: amidohydrolase family protein [Bacteroidia bacterium]|jgi:imidazolonepropionase-like amidohydrolase|nr:amidohydrolase family protein [Bacteroidia bacterium]